MKKKTMTLIPVFQVITTKNGQDKSTEILAAVGAGLGMSTMAFLAPMVLGRRRRRSIDNTSEHPFQQYAQNLINHPLFM